MLLEAGPQGVTLAELWSAGCAAEVGPLLNTGEAWRADDVVFISVGQPGKGTRSGNRRSATTQPCQSTPCAPTAPPATSW